MPRCPDPGGWPVPRTPGTAPSPVLALRNAPRALLGTQTLPLAAWAPRALCQVGGSRVASVQMALSYLAVRTIH